MVEPSVYFWKAPSRPRRELTWLMDSLRIRWAVERLGVVSWLAPPVARELRKPVVVSPRLPVETDWMPRLVLRVSLTSDPSWKVAPPPVMPKLLVCPALRPAES